MSQKVIVTSDTVHVWFSDESADHVDVYEIVADFDLEGNPVGFEAFDFKSPPLGDIARLDAPHLTASFVPEDNALAVWFMKDPRSSDQEVLDAEFGFSKMGLLIFAKYRYQRGAAARKHKAAQRRGV